MKNKHFFRLFACLLQVVVLFLFTACSDIMGYSVLLWSIPEKGLYDGDIVPVYIKSNISHVYVIGFMDSDEKIEVPLWQITEPDSKRKIENQATKYVEYKHKYARVVLDGLPMRSDPVNTSKQIYRLKEGEVIKVLYKGTGAAVMSGSNAMAGDWLHVLASDGTIGWCFSYNLRLFDETAQSPVVTENKEEFDEVLEKILTSNWYPEAYQTMVQKKMIDVERINSYSAFDSGKVSGQTRFQFDDILYIGTFSGVTKTSKRVYKFNDQPIVITYKNNENIVLQYTNEKGMPTSFNLVTLEKSSKELIKEELARRALLFETLKSRGPVFSSSNYGSLQFIDDNSFTWKGYRLLNKTLIPVNSGNKGTVSFPYFLDSSIAYLYDGVLLLTFEKTQKQIIFLYKMEDNGLRLEDASKAVIRNNILQERNQNPIVLYFSKQELKKTDSISGNSETSTNNELQDFDDLFIPDTSSSATGSE